MRCRFRCPGAHDSVAIGHRLVLLKQTWWLLPPVNLVRVAGLHAPHLVHTVVQLPSHLLIRLRIEAGRELVAALRDLGRPHLIPVPIEAGISFASTRTGSRLKGV